MWQLSYQSWWNPYEEEEEEEGAVEAMAEASPAPGMVGVVALVETDSGAEARSEVSAEHLNINFNNPEVRKKKGLKYFILQLH